MIIRVKDGDELARKGKSVLMEKIHEAAELKKGNIILGLTGGRSVKGILEQLAHETDSILKRVHFFWVDERVVPVDNEDSNYKLAHKLFLKKMIENSAISPEQVHPLPYQEPRSLIISDYNDELVKMNEFLSFDVMLLGVGEDGHIGALYPDHHSIRNKRLSYIYMDDSPKPPPERITASRRIIQNSRVAIAIFHTAAKADALKRYLDSKVPMDKCPVKLINKLKEHIVLTDLP